MRELVLERIGSTFDHNIDNVHATFPDEFNCISWEQFEFYLTDCTDLEVLDLYEFITTFQG